MGILIKIGLVALGFIGAVFIVSSAVTSFVPGVELSVVDVLRTVWDTYLQVVP